MKKILYYNWTHVDGSNGGGVTVYQRNLIEEMLNDSEYSITYLNSGLTYESKKDTYIKEVENSLNDSIKCFEIINSPVLAPVQQSIRNIDKYLKDEMLYKLLKEFIIRQNGFDIIHFNNFEGLSINVLKLKNDFPKMKFIYSAHNYFPICSRVNLWKDEIKNDGHNCDKISFNECKDCYKNINYDSEVFCRKYKTLKGKYKIASILSKISPDKGDPKLYQEFVDNNITYFNKYIDVILAVSSRVKNILVNSGFCESKIKVSYIGTKVAENQIKSNNANIYSEIFNIMYMGYMRDDKGFYFFLDALNKIDDMLASQIGITVVAKYSKNKHKNELDQLKKLKSKFNRITIVNGYNAENQKKLLQGIHLGVVPVLWEDNLPQVALEQVAYGVPILVSNLGGASEICKGNINFVFESGNTVEFLSKIENIINNRVLLKEFWNYTIPLVTMKQHVMSLKKEYS